MVRCGCPPPSGDSVPAGAKTFFVPVSSILVEETVAIPKVYLIGQRAKMSAVTTGLWATTPELLDDVANGLVQDIGSNYSRLNVMPDVFFTGSGSTAKWTGWDATTMNPRRILDSDAGETSPLGRAELLKLVALLTGAEDAGNTIFSLIAARYYEARKAATKAVRRRPVVMLGLPSPGWGWGVTRGTSHLGQLLRDASAEYRNHANGVIAAINGSTMTLAQAQQYFASADYWINAYYTQADGARFTMELMSNGYRSSSPQGDRMAFSKFQAFQCAQVLSDSNALQQGLSGNPIHELGVVRPDLILLDLVYFLHPYLRTESELFAKYVPTFYFQLPPLANSNGIPACPMSRLPATPAAGSAHLQRGFAVQGSVFAFRDALYPDIADRVASAFGVDRSRVDFSIINATTTQNFIVEITISTGTCDACSAPSSASVPCDVATARRLEAFAPSLQAIVSSGAVTATASPGVIRCASRVVVPFNDISSYTPGSSTTKSDDSLSDGAIVGIAIGCFVFVVLVIIGVVCAYRIGHRKGYALAPTGQEMKGRTEPTN